MENSPNSAVRLGSQVRRYTQTELALLERFTDRRYSERELIELFPGRTVEAVKNKIASVRRGLGSDENESAPDVSPTVLDPDDPGFDDGWWRKQRKSMAFCNSQFVAALQRYAA